MIAGVSAISSMILATITKPWLQTITPMIRMTHLGRGDGDVRDYLRGERVVFVHETEVAYTQRCELMLLSHSCFHCLLPAQGAEQKHEHRAGRFGERYFI